MNKNVIEIYLKGLERELKILENDLKKVSIKINTVNNIIQDIKDYIE